MDKKKLIETLIELTGNWEDTMELLESYPLERKAPPSAPDVKEPKKKKPKKDKKKKKPGRPKAKIKTGSIKEEILDAIEMNPESSVRDIAVITERNEDEVKNVAAHCKAMINQKILVRRRNAEGVWVYSTPGSLH
jgi:hypothetical protein